MKTIASGANFSAVDFGKFIQQNTGIENIGKVFGGEAVGATGSEFSYQVMQPGEVFPFIHAHKTHEELYFFLAGKGEYQVDGEVIPVEEGTVIRVAPEGKRIVRNNGTEPLVMLCVQYKANAFSEADAPMTDGIIIEGEAKW